MSKSANQLFKKVYGTSTNFMTPNVLKRGVKGNFAYEISEGEGFNREPIFGVTFINRATETQEYDLSKMVYSLQEANEYLEEVS